MFIATVLDRRFHYRHLLSPLLERKMIGGTVIRGDEMLAIGGFVTVVKGCKSDFVVFWKEDSCSRWIIDQFLFGDDACLVDFFWDRLWLESLHMMFFVQVMYRFDEYEEVFTIPLLGCQCFLLAWNCHRIADISGWILVAEHLTSQKIVRLVPQDDQTVEDISGDLKFWLEATWCKQWWIPVIKIIHLFSLQEGGNSSYQSLLFFLGLLQVYRGQEPTRNQVCSSCKRSTWLIPYGEQGVLRCRMWYCWWTKSG